MEKRRFNGVVLIKCLVLVVFLGCSTARMQSNAGSELSQDNGIIIKSKYVLTSGGPIEGGIICIRDGKILSVSEKVPEGIRALTVLDLTSHVVSPGLINSHDHVSYNQMTPSKEVELPYVEENARYDQRNDWRKGLRGHKRLSYKSDFSKEVVAWGELRQIISGTTTVVSSGGTDGLLRNLGNEKPTSSKLDSRREGLVSKKVFYNVFPLGDTKGQQITQGLDYPKHPKPEELTDVIYVPHVSEGVDQVARNEFINLSRDMVQHIGTNTYACYDILSTNVMFIHMIALLRDDAQLAATKGVNHVWSPRSNLALYGNTAYVPLYKALGMNISLSTDWSCSGSMNLLRELALACDLNENYFNKAFSNKELWQMVTVNAAKALQASSSIGDIKPGMLADLCVVKISGFDDPFEAVIKARIENIALAMRGGKVLYGDKAVLEGIPANTGGQWDELDVNGVAKLVDVLSETGFTLGQLQEANQNSYPLFFKGAPPDEPEGRPIRKFNPQCPGIGLYPIYPKDEDHDQDGIKDGDDNAPKVFNPIRPVDVLNDKGQCPME